MTYKLLVNDTSLILKLSDTVDLSETTEIKEAIKSEPKAGFNDFIIEAAEIKYMDSSAVAVMIYAKRIAEESQMKFIISTISTEGEKIIKMAGLSTVFTLPKTKPVEASQEDINLSDDNPLDIGVELNLNIEDEKVDIIEESVETTLNVQDQEDQDQVKSSDTKKGDDFSFEPGTFD